MSPTRIRNLILALAAAMVAVAAWFWFVRPIDAPKVELVTIQGEKISIAQLRGQVVLVNFWASDCTVCVREMPAMGATYRKYRRQGFEALFVSMPHDRPDHVLEFARSNELPFKVALDVQGSINRAFGGIEYTPTTFIIDKRGRIVRRIVGEPDFARLHELIARELAESG